MRFNLKTISTISILAFLSLLVMPIQAFQEITPENLDDPLQARIFQLDNGLTVYISENDQEPRFYAEIGVRVGGKDDPADATGLSHYFEHLMFKGTQKLGTLDYAQEKVHLDKIRELYETRFQTTNPDQRAELEAAINEESQLASQFAIPNEMDRTYKALGGSGINAFTSYEYTVYTVDLPKTRLEQWAQIESDRFQNPVFRLFASELEVVYEEKNRAIDSKDRLIYEAVIELLFKNHPYGQQSILGSVEHLKNPSIVKIEEFFGRYYIPRNIVISISGDVDADEAIKIIDEHFSGLNDPGEPVFGSWDEEPLTEVERVEITYPGEEYVMVGFRTAHYKSEDRHALSILDMILDNQTAGLINLNLSNAQLVRGAGSYPYILNDYGTQFLWGIPKPEQTLEEVEQLLLGQIDLIKAGDFDDWIIAAIVNDFKKSEMLKLENNTSRAGFMRDAFMHDVPYAEHALELEKFSQVMKEDVVRVANKYFSQGYVVGYRRDGQHDIPKLEKPALDKVEIDPTRQSEFGKEILAQPSEDLEPKFLVEGEDYVVSELGDGRFLYYTNNPLNDLFTLSFTVPIGDEHNNALPAAARLIELAGTETLSPEELNKEWYRLGTDFSIGVGDNETRVTISGLDENFDESVRLLIDVLMHSTIDEETWPKLKSIILAERADARKDPQTVQRALVLYLRQGHQSPFLSVPSSAAMELLDPEELLATIADLGNTVHDIEYAGPQDYEAIRSRFASPTKLRAAPPEVLVPYRKPRETELYFVDRETAQSQVRIESTLGRYNESDRPAISLYNDYFAGGMGGIVFQELREARALAYVAGARLITADHPKRQNLMVGVIGTQPDKTITALEAFEEIWDDLPVTQGRFDQSKAALESRYRTERLSFRQVNGAVRAWKKFGFEGDPRPERYEATKKMTFEDMLLFYRDNVQNQPKKISVVGESARIDMESLKGFAKYKEVSVEDIFVD